MNCMLHFLHRFAEFLLKMTNNFSNGEELPSKQHQNTSKPVPNMAKMLIIAPNIECAMRICNLYAVCFDAIDKIDVLLGVLYGKASFMPLIK